MIFSEMSPPREFRVGAKKEIVIKDCGSVNLDHDEQITFVTNDGKEYDVARKEWGFYATPSMNSRLSSFRLKAVLVKNDLTQYFVMLVEEGKEDLFKDYLEKESQSIVTWLDSTDAITKLESALGT